MCKYVVVDLEMCSVPKMVRKEKHCSSMELIQIGAVLLDEFYNIEDNFSTFVKPQYGTIDKFIQNLTGITTNDIEKAPDTKSALEAFVDWLPEDGILVSWSENDEFQIRVELENKNLCIPKLNKYLDRWVDCQKTFSDKMHSPKIYNLTEALNITGIDYEDGAHDALVDAHNTALLFSKMENELELNTISYYADNDIPEFSNNPFSILLENYNLVTC